MLANNRAAARIRDHKMKPARTQYRHEAERLRREAATITDDVKLRERYLILARDYERLAETLEDRSPTYSIFKPFFADGLDQSFTRIAPKRRA
jgi:hypothetical protein